MKLVRQQHRGGNQKIWLLRLQEEFAAELATTWAGGCLKPWG